jgi:predicted protein tyrosine phosphatase
MNEKMRSTQIEDPEATDGASTGVKEEKYTPTRGEILNAESQMSMEQRAQSNVRQIFIESEHRILDLPEDFEYVRESRYAGSSVTQNIRGTFDGRLIELSKNVLPDRSLSDLTFGRSDGQELSHEEAAAIWVDLHPVAKAYSGMQKAENAAKESVQEEIAKGKVRPEDIEPREPHQYRIKDEKLAQEIALKEKQKMDETRQLLDKKIEQMELEDTDKEFIDRIKEEVIKLSVLEFRSGKTFLGEEKPQGYIYELPRYKTYVRNNEYVPQEITDEYERQKELIIQLLGADKENVQKWVIGFGYSHPDSDVYDTMFPDIILREAINTEHNSSEAGRQLLIERNSRYQKTGEK